MDAATRRMQNFEYQAAPLRHAEDADCFFAFIFLALQAS